VIRPAARWPVALSAALLGACSSLPAPRPVPPAVPAPAAVPAPPAAVPKPPADLASIPDAVPRVEPRSRYGNPVSYVVFGQRYQLLSTAEGHVERGTASWYGPGFHAARTSSGEPYDMYAMTAAHKTLPIPAYARVTNLRNGRSVVVRINDRGPFVGDRIIDLSYTAAWKLDMLRTGTAPVEVRVLSPGADVPPVMVASVPVPSAPPAAASVSASRGSPPLAASTGSAAAVAAGTGVGAAAPSRTMLQAGAFFDAANARSLVARLAAAGIGNATLRPTRAGARTVWQVRVGPLDSGLEVDDMLERLRLAGLPDARRALD
jgi:rare lipoprotein A